MKTYLVITKNKYGELKCFECDFVPDNCECDFVPLVTQVAQYIVYSGDEPRPSNYQMEMIDSVETEKVSVIDIKKLIICDSELEKEKKRFMAWHQLDREQQNEQRELIELARLKAKYEG